MMANIVPDIKDVHGMFFTTGHEAVYWGMIYML